jgi:hypothetical protein
MKYRVRLLLLVVVPSYSLWNHMLLTVGSPSTPAVIGANITLGILIGILATFLADNDSKRLHLRDGLVTLIFFGMLAFVFAAFSIRGPGASFLYNSFGEIADPAGMMHYLWRFTWRGLLFGLGLWLLTAANVGLIRGGIDGLMLTVGTATLGILVAPFAANALFNGATLVVLSVAMRLTLGLSLQWIDSTVRGFIFGVAAGMIVVLLPFFGLNSYGIP